MTPWDLARVIAQRSGFRSSSPCLCILSSRSVYLTYVHNEAFICFLSQTAMLGLRFIFPFQNLFWTFMLSEGRFSTVRKSENSSQCLFLTEQRCAEAEEAVAHLCSGCSALLTQSSACCPRHCNESKFGASLTSHEAFELSSERKDKKYFQVGTLHSISFKVSRIAP